MDFETAFPVPGQERRAQMQTLPMNAEVLIQVTFVKSALTCQVSSGDCGKELGPESRGYWRFLDQFPFNWDSQQV